jgi:hypothetical protein
VANDGRAGWEIGVWVGSEVMRLQWCEMGGVCTVYNKKRKLHQLSQCSPFLGTRDTCEICFCEKPVSFGIQLSREKKKSAE